MTISEKAETAGSKGIEAGNEQPVKTQPRTAIDVIPVALVTPATTQVTIETSCLEYMDSKWLVYFCFGLLCNLCAGYSMNQKLGKNIS